MLSPDKRKRLFQLLGMIGSCHDGEVLNAAKLAQQLLGSEGLTWDEALNGAEPRRADGRTYAEGYRVGHSDGYRKGLAEGRAAGMAAKRKPVPSDWQELAQELLDDYELSEWETEFCASFVARGWDTPTAKQRVVFERMCRKLDVELPD